MGDLAGGMANDQRVTAPSDAAASDNAAADLVPVCCSVRLPRAAYHFYRALLLTFPMHGGPPDHTTLRHLARRFGVELHATLALLASQDLVQRDSDTGAITAAYPFSSPPTPHRVTILSDPDETSGTRVYAMCALDALGIPLMLRQPALLTSVDPVTSDTVRVRVWPADAMPNGLESGLPGWVTDWDPETAVVYARPEDRARDCGQVALLCRCPVTNFFATASHAHRWAEQHGAAGDVVLAHSAALQRADRRFGGLLDRLAGSADPT